MIVEVNWDHFGAKFSEDKQRAFERLCYLLFCKEHNKDIGIFRFKNHAGIETNPIEVDEKVIGWQAKFYTTPLSKNQQEFIDSIDAAKARHPTINEIIFYTNQEFGQAPQKSDPEYKTRIEVHARSKGVEIEWRTASYFESPFVCEQNFSIAQYCFSLKKGILGSIHALSTHTDSLLKQIRSEITFGAKKIKLDRSVVLDDLKQALSGCPLLILSGGAGVGKTAVVKDFYESVKDTAPLLVFKATQFNNVSTAEALLKSFGELTLSDFINEHNDIDTKYVVIDSAEKLSDIENQEAFQIFLSALLDGGWNIIFTVRYNYLDDLKFQLEEIYNVNFQSLNIPNLSSEDLEKVSTDYDFKLPRNERSRCLLQVPLYLNEWLQSYKDVDVDISHSDFRDLIWRKQIQHSIYQKNNIHVRREECFLKIAKERADSGNFFVKANEFDQEALSKLNQDGIIERDTNIGGYFITHDVYEEWALDKIIERSFRNAQDHPRFYQEIGSSLPIRRAFRNWLSDKLFINDESAKKLIEFTVSNTQIDNHWKDEVLVSMLLSDYSSVFFEHFEEELLKTPEKIVSYDDSSKVVRTLSVHYQNENSLLYRILFLLRIACKTIDEDFLRLLGVTKTEGIAFKTVFTTPKGKGWDCSISFVNKHKEALRFRYMNAILPVLDDWNNKNKEGESTKNASQTALFYYDELTNQEGFYFSSRDETKNKLIRTILNGSREIKAELTRIIDEVVATKDTSHMGRYYELVKATLSSLIESAEIAKNLPKEVMRLANLFWFYTPKETGWHSDYRNDIEQYFDLSSNHHDYYPASAFQTPTFCLLQSAPKEAVDFILSFTNKSIEYFAKTEFAQHEAEEVKVFIDPSPKPIKQYICHRIWNIYRGTQVTPTLLESMHMALERWLLMIAKAASSEVLESWCLYLIKNSRSTSITAVVASIILAEPSKVFNVAQILFRTKEFFFFDTARMQLDMTAKSIYSISHDPEGIFMNERLKTCEDKHRSHSLEHQALNFQLFRSEDENEEVAKKRQEVLWKIFDDHYAQLSDKSRKSEADKTWRLYLARMDRRKMNITTERKDDQVLIQFNPEIDPELRSYSEESLAKSSEAMKYTPLRLWSRYRFERNESEYQKYPRYDNDHRLVISDTKEIVKGLQNDESEEKTFTLFYHSVPPCTCGVLIRDYFSQLSEEEKEFCRNIILEYASMPLKNGYHYQAGDGVDVAINALPLLLKSFPRDSKTIKETLLFTLFDSYPIGMSQRLSDYSVSAILQHLWKESSIDANSLFLGYLFLKPKFDDLRELVRKENHKRNIYDLSNSSVLQRFIAVNESEIVKVTSNQITYEDVPVLAALHANTLVTAFLLLPFTTTDENHKKFVSSVSSILTKILSERDQERRFDYTLRHLFLEKFAYFVLHSNKEDIATYTTPFIENFSNLREAADIFSEFVSAEDKLDQYDAFWTVWDLFYPKIVELCKSESMRFHSSNVVHNYLFAWSYWKQDAKEWHSLKEREKAFFKKVAEDLGGHPAVLYSLSKLLNEIGRGFVDDGIFWISDVLQKNQELTTKELEVNTVYYLENLVRGYILRNRHKVRITPQIKNHVLVVLNFLLEKESVTAYMLREDIL